MPLILAHGALGPYDELIFAAVGLVFIVMMGVSWLRSRGEALEDDDDLPAAEPTAEDTDHYRLQ